MSIKLIASDMDGTLLNSDARLSPRTIAAAKAAMAHGAHFVLASGRMIEAILFAARDIGVNAPIIAYNGGATYDTAQHQIIHQVPIRADIARELASFAELMDLHVQGYRDGGYFVARHNQYSSFYTGSIRIEANATGMPISEWISGDQMKLLIISEPERIDAALPLFVERFSGRINCTRSIPQFIECTAIGADKGAALKQLSAQLGIASDEIMAFGDAGNDVEMLTFAGHSFAMQSGSERAKACAKHIAPTCDEDGVAQIIEQYIADGRISH